MEEERKHIPIPMEALVVLLGGYFFFIMVNLLLSVFLSPGEENIAADSLYLKVFLVLGELSLAVVPVIYLKKHDYDLREMFRFRPIPLRVALLSVVVGLGAMILFDEIDRLINLLFPISEEYSEVVAQTMKSNSLLETLLLILSVIILAAVIEEAIFRGFLQGVMEHHINATRAVIYGSLAWTIFHLNPLSAGQAVPIFLFGFLAGYLVWRSGSVYPGMICHAINNGIAVLYYNWDFEAVFPAYEWNGHVSPLMLLIAAALVYKGTQLIDAVYLSDNFSSSSSSSSE